MCCCRVLGCLIDQRSNIFSMCHGLISSNLGLSKVFMAYWWALTILTTCSAILLQKCASALVAMRLLLLLGTTPNPTPLFIHLSPLLLCKCFDDAHCPLSPSLSLFPSLFLLASRSKLRLMFIISQLTKQV